MPGKEVRRGWRLRWGLFCRMAKWVLCLSRMYNHLQDHPLCWELCLVCGCHPGWQTGLGAEEEDGALGRSWWMLWILFPKESEDIRMVEIKRNNMGAGLEVFSLEAPFLYLQRCEASLTAARMRRLTKMWAPEQNMFDWRWKCVFAFGCKSVCSVMNVACMGTVIKMVTLQPLPRLPLPPFHNFTFSRPRNWPLIYPTGMLLLFQKSYFTSLSKRACPFSTSHTHFHSATNRNATINGVVWTVL